MFRLDRNALEDVQTRSDPVCILLHRSNLPRLVEVGFSFPDYLRVLSAGSSHGECEEL